MGAGKSTVGVRLAQLLGWSFVDLDEEIVRTEGKSIAGIFEESGETYFRQLENHALIEVLTRDGCVVALGGGALETVANQSALQNDPESLLVYLEAPLEALMARCEQQRLAHPAAPRRPVFENRPELTARFLRRRPLYEAAHWRIETADTGMEETVQTILRKWNEHTSRAMTGPPNEK